MQSHKHKHISNDVLQDPHISILQFKYTVTRLSELANDCSIKVFYLKICVLLEYLSKVL